MKLLYSIIVPSYNSSGMIEECIHSLLDQTVPFGSYEIIVVDDGSVDNTAEVVSACPVRYYYQPNQGAAAARNYGAYFAKGSILLFTDADCQVSPNWIEEMVKPFKDPEIVATKGFYGLSQKELVARFVQKEYEEKYRYLLRNKYVDFVDTYSAAYRKDVFFEFGGFDTSFSTASAEDCDLSYKVAAQGYKIVPSQNAIVFHYHPVTIKSYWKKKYRNAFWRAKTWRQNPEKIVKDSHTPFLLKLQILLWISFLAAPVVYIFEPAAAAAFVVIQVIVFLGTTMPFALRTATEDPVLGLLSPALITLRTSGYIAGLSAKLLQIITRKTAKLLKAQESLSSQK
jgi:glycosyltransferase involved in cell wall biosynthesis